MSNLTSKTIENTYKSILNVGTESNPNGTLTTNLSVITDGQGNASSLAIGTANNGIRVTGQVTSTGPLSAGVVRYPSVDGAAKQVLMTNGNGVLSFSTIGPDSLSSIFPNPGSTYVGNISSITVNDKGLVTNVGLAGYTSGSIVWLGTTLSITPTASNNNWGYYYLDSVVPLHATSVIIQQSQAFMTGGSGDTYCFIDFATSTSPGIVYFGLRSNDASTSSSPNAGFQGTYPIDKSTGVARIAMRRNKRGNGATDVEVIGYII